MAAPLKLARATAASIEPPATQGRWFTFIEEVRSQTEVLVEQMTIPFQKTQPIQRFTAGSFRYYPNMFDVDGIQVVFFETWDFRVTRWLYDWKRRVYDQDTGTFGMPKDYRREFLTEFYPTDSEDPVMRKLYLGTFPVEQQPFEMTYAEIDGRITVSSLFCVNTTRIEFPDTQTTAP